MSNLTITQIEEKLCAIIADVKRIASNDVSLNANDDFINKYHLTSMDAVSLSVRISEDFGFGFGQEAEDIDGLASFGSLTQLIQKRVA
ncbi:acyl carrier protein [Saccharophagus degradans]|uniref:Acyl carrier protein n=1 Tax=Saccharophagus degradans TaxID=86304 RepID=A0AAW7XB13_9GAMM|nr:acyl carrier protein [Saccharophagus degradans]MBU2986217.1 acyl carrier protein [Saccharophagus degradans]MDO6423703.1 acyl carrier protein [Saccharophagus degradans]MDO6607626.1 acyl carrier protein [Saccharophagus degradans]WGO99064.1 acyl carrier protein [Saccharophagus degradans]